MAARVTITLSEIVKADDVVFWRVKLHLVLGFERHDGE
jgi:hypothetical protein